MASNPLTTRKQQQDFKALDKVIPAAIWLLAYTSAILRLAVPPHVSTLLCIFSPLGP